MENPFKILGIAPETCKGMKDEDLFKFVKSCHKALQTIYHPDIGGEHNKSIDINLAFEHLNYKNDPDKFKNYKKQYTKKFSRKSKIKELEIQIEEQKRQFEKATENYYQYILNQVGCDEHKYSISSLKNMTIGLYDVAIKRNLPINSRLYGENYKVIKLNPKGRAFVRDVGSSSFCERRISRFIGTIPKEEIEIYSHLKLKGYRTSSHSRTILNRRNRFSDNIEPVYNNIFYKENFITSCLPYLVPSIKEQSYLISYNVRSLDFILDGCIIKITREND